MLTRTEMEKYFVEDVETLSETFDILMWWKVNSAKYPVLSEIVRMSWLFHLPPLLLSLHLALEVAS
jgi:hypothetical protein